MPVPKKRTTPISDAANVESSDHKMPDEQDFRQSMRNLAVSAMRVVIEAVMREELEQCLGAAWGECTPSRTGERHGSSTRDLVTKTGRILPLPSLVMHRSIRTTNAIESFFRNVRQRTDQIETFTTETSCLTIVWAVMQDIHMPRIPVS